MRISRDCFANFVADFRMTFVQVQLKCHENFHVLRNSRKLVAKVLNMFKIFFEFFLQNISQDWLATVMMVVRVSRF